MDQPRQARLARLLKQARDLPAGPGVYLMKDAQGTVVYVGKALNLPDRASSYFVPSADLGPQKQPMLEVIEDIEAIPCQSEWEALLTEARLVKDLRPTPRFNTRLKDGKTFPYLIVTQREDYPRVLVTRDPRQHADLGSKVFGPFTNSNALREGVQMLQRVFKFRTCGLDIVAGDKRNRFFRPCLLHAIDRCTAPCAERISPGAYRVDVDRFVRFLNSKQSVMLRELQAEMNEASRAQRFEHAAVLRDQIKTLEKLGERGRVSDGFQPETEALLADPGGGCRSLQRLLKVENPVRCVEGFDIAHLMGNQTVASKVCFMDGRPFKEQYRRFKINSAGNDDYTAMREVISRRFREAGAGQELYPDVILIDGGPGQLAAAMEAFATLQAMPPMVVSLAKKEELVYVQGEAEPRKLSRGNLGLRLLQAVRDEAHRFAQAYHHVLRGKAVLGEQ
ncbi:MAG: UvrB/UvrC motif-containing protein [bacterium]